MGYRISFHQLRMRNDAIFMLVLALTLFDAKPTQAQTWSVECTSSGIPFASTGYNTDDEGSIETLVNNVVACSGNDKILLKVDSDALQDLQNMVATVEAASPESGLRTAASRGLNLRYACQNSPLGCYVANVARGAYSRGSGNDDDKLYNLQFSAADGTDIGKAVNFNQFSNMAAAAEDSGLRNGGQPIDETALSIINDIGKGYDLFAALMSKADVTPDNVDSFVGGTDRTTAGVRSTATSRTSAGARSAGAARG